MGRVTLKIDYYLFIYYWRIIELLEPGEYSNFIDFFLSLKYLILSRRYCQLYINLNRLYIKKKQQILQKIC